MMNYSTEKLANQIQELNHETKDTRKNFRLTCWIILEVGEVDGELVYNPKAEVAKKSIEEIIIKGV